MKVNFENIFTKIKYDNTQNFEKVILNIACKDPKKLWACEELSVKRSTLWAHFKLWKECGLDELKKKFNS